MDCRVVLEAGVPVYDVESADESIRIAISKTGEMINPDLNYVEIEVGERTSPSGEELEPAFVVSGAALVALTFEMDVFNVDREEHASRIARTEIGERLEDIPLEVITVEVIDDPADEEREDHDPEDTSGESGADTGNGSAADDGRGEESTKETGGDVLPTFEELLEE